MKLEEPAPVGNYGMTPGESSPAYVADVEQKIIEARDHLAQRGRLLFEQRRDRRFRGDRLADLANLERDLQSGAVGDGQSQFVDGCGFESPARSH